MTGLFYSLNQHYIAREAEEPGRGAGGAGGAGGGSRWSRESRWSRWSRCRRAAVAGRSRPVPPEQAGGAEEPEQAGAGRSRPGEAGGAGPPGGWQKKKKKKKIDRRFNRIYIRRRRKGERPSRDAAAKLCHKVWLFFDNLIKRRLCYGT